MIDSLITNKTRVKLILKFFLNPGAKSYLRKLATEFGESTNAIRLELNRFEQAGLLISSMEKNKKIFRTNREHPLFGEINSIVRKSVGVDQLLGQVVQKLGNVVRAYLIGHLAMGSDNKEIHFILIGENIDRDYLDNLIEKVQGFIHRKIVCLILKSEEEEEVLSRCPEALLVWSKR
jgi:hypothetical protein